MEVPAVPQRGNAPANDCGPAAVAMMAGVTRPDLATMATVTSLSRRFDVADDGTTPQDLIAMAAHLDIALRWGPDVAYPYIALVDYETLPRENRSQATMRIPHYIVRVSDTEYRDSYWWTPEQVRRTAPKHVLDAAERNVRTRLPKPCRIGFASAPVIPPQTVDIPQSNTSMTNMISRGGNARTQPIALTPDLAPVDKTAGTQTRIVWVPRGTRVDVVSRANGWSKVRGAVAGTPFDAFMSDGVLQPESVVAPPVVTPAPVPPTTRLGEPLLGVHVRMKHHLAEAALTAGCRYVVIMHGKMFAVQMAQKYPDALIVYRPWLDRGYLPSVEQTMMALECDGNEPDNMALQLTNESDSIGTSAGEIRAYADYMRKCIAEIRRRGSKAKIMLPSWGHGNPPRIESDAEIQRAIREEFSALYNAGEIMFDLHNYSAGRVVDIRDDDIWLVRRFVWFFTHCGFDPRVRNFWSSETGVEAGAGGFQWAGYSDEELYRWCASHQRVTALPITVNGVEYQSPYRGGALFCLNDETENKSGNWFGYTIWQRQIPVLAKHWFDVKNGVAVPRGYVRAIR